MDWHVVLAVFYFLPLLIALLRHQRRVPVAILNTLLGWTIVGWIVALMIAMWPGPRVPVTYVEVPYDGSTYGTR